ncbi:MULTISPECIES: relaxase/mobilization nuclease domain-containing protein [Clostridia]|jgi:predicted  nucleic acid-binding Zn-ribbon protein|uniref:relaxase/mobilization nuclease domain-containing protein n=1 Tax=Clostridia TaxID=186801 RepID=UPI00031DF1E4|nr:MULTISPECIES: relaxase/mobilization nuclease domain-containing protein [Clostridia]MCQ4864030.1 relaxase/mobilization nuclease domain-containing protein [Pseudoflavonifractor phocaeensis]MDV5056619.1 relaxase/mobilization nuclease domain-containing protein [Faecalibacterium duncaniae]SCI76415.1 Relaxase/Mobilisation nuclease domain [uncultured Flavonifractor sp.]SCJ27999.1 Relaxase/Mobilisation nuclease domain [uncultured Clostridium sp.]
MAVTKIKAIRGTLSKAIAYILNPEKTDEKLLVSSYGCASETAAREFEWTRKIAEQKGMNPVRIIARHVIQSFEIGEVTPELAHEIGKQFADEILGGKYEYVLTTHIDKDHVHNHLIFNAVDFVDYHAYKSYKRIYYDMREVSDRLCKENGLSVIPPSQNKGMGYKEYTEAKRGTSWKQKLKQTIDRLVITAKDYDDFLRLMQEAGYEIKTGKYISFRAEGQERFTRSKTIGENYTEERIKERIAGRTPRRNRRQTVPKGISLIGDIQERIRLIDSKGYEYKAKLTILKEAARTLNYLTENNLLQYADLEKKVEDVHSSYDRTGKELKGVEARLREVQPLIKNISNYQRLKPVYDAFQKAKDKPGFKAKHEAELVIFEAARSTLLAMQGDEKLPSLKTLQAQQQRLLDEQQRLYDERAKLKKEVKQIETIKSNVDTFLAPSADHDRDHLRSTQRE